MLLNMYMLYSHTVFLIGIPHFIEINILVYPQNKKNINK